MCIRDSPGIRISDARHVGEDDHLIRAQGAAQGDGCGIAAAPAQGNQVLVGVAALEAGNHGDRALAQYLFQPGRVHRFHDAVGKIIVGGDAGLETGQGAGRKALGR